MKLLTSLLLMVAAVASAQRTINVTAVNYTDVDGFQLQGFVSNSPPGGALRPVVVIIHDASGINIYEQARATLLNEIGYVGFAADIFGEHNVVDSDRRRELLTLYRSNVTLFVQRIKAAVTVAKTLEGVDPTKVAIIGYCFGGTGVLVSNRLVDSALSRGAIHICSRRFPILTHSCNKKLLLFYRLTVSLVKMMSKL